MAKKRNTRSEKDNLAISYKIKKLQAEGLPTDRATAAAFRMYRDGELSVTTTPKSLYTKSGRQKAIAVGYASLLRSQNRRRKRIMKKINSKKT